VNQEQTPGNEGAAVRGSSGEHRGMWREPGTDVPPKKATSDINKINTIFMARRGSRQLPRRLALGQARGQARRDIITVSLAEMAETLAASQVRKMEGPRRPELTRYYFLPKGKK